MVILTRMFRAEYVDVSVCDRSGDHETHQFIYTTNSYLRRH